MTITKACTNLDVKLLKTVIINIIIVLFGLMDHIPKSNIHLYITTSWSEEAESAYAAIVVLWVVEIICDH